MKCTTLFSVFAAISAMTFVLPALTSAAPLPLVSAEKDSTKTVNDRCPISTEAVTTTGGTVNHGDHTIGLCCPGCRNAFLAWDDQRKDEFIQLALANKGPGVETPGDTGAKQNDRANTTQPDDKIKSDPYLLDTCPISGQELGSMGEPVVKTIKGREVKFCCGGCVDQFKDNSEKYFAEIDKKMIKQQLPYYPLQTCAVMEDSKLGSMGEPVNHIYKNRLVRFCCKMCKKGFNEDPKAYIDKIDKAIIKQQSKHYPLQTCAVLDDSKLGSMGEPKKIVVASRLVQFCCAGCKPAFDKNPAGYIARIDKAWKDHGHMPGEGGKPHDDLDDHKGHDGDGHDHGHSDHDHH